MARAIVRHFDCPEEVDPPQALVLWRHLGDNRMLSAGGLLDQPAALWFRVQYAGWVWSLLEKIASSDLKDLKANEMDFYVETIQPIRMGMQ